MPVLKGKLKISKYGFGVIITDDPKKRIDFIFGHKIDIENDYHTIKLYGQDPSEDTKSDPGHGMLDNDSPMWASDHRAIMLTLNMS